MPITINTTPADHIPEDFTIEGLTEAGFTEQEIKALTEGDDPILTAPAGDGAPQEAAAADAAAVGDAASVAAAIQQQQTPAPAAEAQQPQLPEIPDTTEAEQTVQRVAAALEALADEYDNGELTKAEFVAKQAELAREEARARVAIENATRITQQARDAILTHWYQRLDAYKATAPGLFEPEHVEAFDQQLRLVTSAPAYADLNRDQQIRLAHTLYAAAYEARTGKPLAGNAALPNDRQQGAADKKMQVRQDERPQAPRTLAGFNSDSSAEIEDSSFAAIDREIMRDPLASERLFARMTPEQQERFLTEV